MTTQLSRSFLSISAHFKFDARSIDGRQAPSGHAIVVGGGAAGLMAGQVLSRHFAQVTIVDRDLLTESPAARVFRRAIRIP
jgi:threonine dehydrogenase-like Zn-dependent dehydrogenase